MRNKLLAASILMLSVIGGSSAGEFKDLLGSWRISGFGFFVLHIESISNRSELRGHDEFGNAYAGWLYGSVVLISADGLSGNGMTICFDYRRPRLLHKLITVTTANPSQVQTRWFDIAVKRLGGLKCSQCPTR